MAGLLHDAPWAQALAGIVRHGPLALWGKKAPKAASVRSIVGRAGAYSAAQDRATMDLKLKPFDFAQAAARAGLRPDGLPLARTAAATGGDSFQAAMAQALQSVSRAQNEAQTLQRELQLDNPGVSLEQTMVAMQKSQLGFQASLQVRNRLVQAYSEIMNMQV